MKPSRIFLLAVALFAIVYFIISKTAPPESTSPTLKTTPASAFKTTPLHEASKTGCLESCQKLIESGADFNALDEFGWSPLLHAVMGDHLETAHMLLYIGASMHYSYQREETPELRAAKDKEWIELNKNMDLAKSLEDSFKDLPEDLRKELTGQEMMDDMRKSMVDLHFEPTQEHAIEHCNNLAMLEMLIGEFGADINHISGDGYWPLSSFAEADDLDAVTWLLENKANPNNTSTGETAIFKAIRNDNLSIVKLLVQNGAKIDAEDCDGWSVLFPCESIIMAKYLIEQGADPTALDQADFPCWNMIDDQETKDFLKKEAQKRGLKKWTELPND
jgi:ankyrin repeat protein